VRDSLPFLEVKLAPLFSNIALGVQNALAQLARYGRDPVREGGLYFLQKSSRAPRSWQSLLLSIPDRKTRSLIGQIDWGRVCRRYGRDPVRGGYRIDFVRNHRAGGCGQSLLPLSPRRSMSGKRAGFSGRICTHVILTIDWRYVKSIIKIYHLLYGMRFFFFFILEVTVSAKVNEAFIV
jgi:hypothetical protein